MKWIGQHIWDFISRFRSDVYLEGTETGTIASGGNLGLDSNNKVVKAAEVGSSVDLTSEVTGVLPVTNGGSGASSLADNCVLTGTGTSPITAESTLFYSAETLNVGAEDDGSAIIKRSSGAAAGGDLELYGGGSASGSNLAGGDIKLHAGLGRGSGTAGRIIFNASMNTVSGSDSHSGVRNSQMDCSTAENKFTVFQPGPLNSDYLEFKVENHGATTITTVDAAAAAANLDFVIDGQFSIASTGIDISGAGVISNAEWQGTAVANTYVADDLTISGGTVDNSIIGGSTPAAITGTTIDANTDFTVGGTEITDSNITLTPSPGDYARIQATANGALSIVTSDSAGDAADITITANGDAEVAADAITLDSAANIELEVGATTNYAQTTGIFRGSNIGVIQDTMLAVKITEFTLSDSSSGDHVYVTSNSRYGFCTDIAKLYYAVVVIPNGYTASQCIVYGADISRSSTFTCYEGKIQAYAGGSPSSIGSTGFGRGATFSSNIVGNGIKTCIIELNWGHAGDFIAGAAITIAKT